MFRVLPSVLLDQRLGDVEIDLSADERIADLELQIERLRAEMDETRSTARDLRNIVDNLVIPPNQAFPGKAKKSVATAR